jgi:hypothetical protein
MDDDTEADDTEWSENDRATFTAHQMIGLLGAYNAVAFHNIDAVREARANLLPALDKLMDAPAHPGLTDLHRRATEVLDALAEKYRAPDLNISGRY